MGFERFGFLVLARLLAKPRRQQSNNHAPESKRLRKQFALTTEPTRTTLNLCKVMQRRVLRGRNLVAAKQRLNLKGPLTCHLLATKV